MKSLILTVLVLSISGSGIFQAKAADTASDTPFLEDPNFKDWDFDDAEFQKAFMETFGFDPADLYKGVRVGNGGDNLRIQMKRAQEEAVAILALIEAKNFNPDGGRIVPGTITQTLNQWIVDNKLKLSADISLAQHVWHEGTTGVCALTNIPGAKNTIFFSNSDCRFMKNADTRSLIELLIHESVHHFGFGNDPDEHSFCDEVAIAVYNAWLNRQAQNVSKWTPISTKKAPGRRSFHTAIWYDTNTSDSVSNPGKDKGMIVWGGCRDKKDEAHWDCGEYLNDGGIYKQANDGSWSWQTITVEDAPRRRAHQTAVWSGLSNNQNLNNKMLVWGGCGADKLYSDVCNVSFADGGIYEIDADKWTSIPKAPIKERVFHTAVWAGDRMIVWGGEWGFDDADKPKTSLNTGASYLANSNSWSEVTTENAPSRRKQHTAVWTGYNPESPAIDNKMIVWGGCEYAMAMDASCPNSFNNGAIYDIKTNSWKPMPTDGAPEPRRLHTAVWTGEYMIVWGGRGGYSFRKGYPSIGGIFDPQANNGQGEWFPMTSNAPLGRAGHVAVWTGNSMMVWGGLNISISGETRSLMPHATVYHPDFSFNDNDYWEIYDNFNVNPIPAQNHSGVWTGNEFIVWGGDMDGDIFLNSGGILTDKN